jgi:hypothetical protein
MKIVKHKRRGSTLLEVMDARQKLKKNWKPQYLIVRENRAMQRKYRKEHPQPGGFCAHMPELYKELQKMKKRRWLKEHPQ